MITVGMACFDDPRGVRWTLTALGVMHDLRDVELVVVDNNPTGRKGAQVRQWLATWLHGQTGRRIGGVKYVPFSEPQGTAAPRDEVFRQAAGGVVVVIDAHVIVAPAGLAALRAHVAADPATRDLLTGPLVYDDLASQATHFADVWRGGMWGTWAYDARAEAGEPFEIGAQGLGLFACRKDAWLGFNPAFREFGGEEWYIHEKFRRAGARCLCIPQLKWWHDFEKPPGVGYPASPLAKARNYIVGLRELGLPLDRARRHLVEGVNEDGSEWEPGVIVRPTVTAAQWDAIVADVDAGAAAAPAAASPTAPPAPPRPAVVAAPRKLPPTGGPGTELKKLLAELGVNEEAGCGCAARAAMMDNLGVEGCRKNRNMFAGVLRDEADAKGYAAKLLAGARAIRAGLLAKLGLGDPYLGLVDEAIRRAEEANR